MPQNQKRGKSSRIFSFQRLSTGICGTLLLPPIMEDWQLDFEWLRVQHLVKDSLRRENLPDLNIVLMLIGIQELGLWKKKWTKEEKQDLMHVGVCTLLSQEDWFEFVGRDDDGWPHFRQVREMPKAGLPNQEKLLKINAIRYFQQMLEADVS